MKIKEISELFGVPASTFHDWQKNPEKSNLAALLASIPKEIAVQYAKNVKPKKQPPLMLLATVNCSIGDKNKHLDAKSVKNLLSGAKPKTVFEKYALDIIKTEASVQEIENFAKYYRIPKKSIMAVLNG